MTTFKIYDEAEMGKWVVQNNAVYTGDFIDGTLLDNFTVWTRRGMAIITEYIENCWTSSYLVRWSKDESLIWDLWDEFEKNYIESLSEEERRAYYEG